MNILEVDLEILLEGYLELQGPGVNVMYYGKSIKSRSVNNIFSLLTITLSPLSIPL